MNAATPATPAPAPEPFVNEDLSKPENRTNLALFSLMLIPEVRHWLLDRLALARDCVIYPPRSITAGRRPDFVVVSPERHVKAWIEVELGGENVGQIEDYRRTLAEPVKSIVGPADAGGDVSLKEIAVAIRDRFLPSLDPQQAISASVFTQLVDQMAGKPLLWDYVDPGAAVQSAPLVAALRERLGPVLTFGKPPIVAGTAQVSTITQGGWTLRVFAKGSSMASVSLMWNQALGSPVTRVPSAATLNRCLPASPDGVAQYVEFLARVGADVSSLKEGQSLALSETSLVAAADELAVHVRRLAEVYGRVTAA